VDFIQANSVFLLKKGACAVVEDNAIHLEREFGHAPKSVADAFLDMWKQTLVIKVSTCMGWHNPVNSLSAGGILLRLANFFDAIPFLSYN